MCVCVRHCEEFCEVLVKLLMHLFMSNTPIPLCIHSNIIRTSNWSSTWLDTNHLEPLKFYFSTFTGTSCMDHLNMALTCLNTKKKKNARDTNGETKNRKL